VFNLWSLLRREFVMLVILALVIATSVAWWFMDDWLQHYEHRSRMPWNPVRSLRSE
jgi:hypothetical protein